LKLYAAQTYLTELAKLSKKKKGLYSSVSKDVESWFKEHNAFALIWGSNYTLRDTGIIRIIKVRLSNSQTNKGSSSGYRLILCCNDKTKTVGLLYIFPKTGPLGMDNINEELEKKLVRRYIEEHKNGSIYCLEKLEEKIRQAFEK
jgi:mRNA-degrading endonuclease RelE of RelBE toxin-antitoxin system